MRPAHAEGPKSIVTLVVSSPRQARRLRIRPRRYMNEIDRTAATGDRERDATAAPVAPHHQSRHRWATIATTNAAPKIFVASTAYPRALNADKATASTIAKGRNQMRMRAAVVEPTYELPRNRVSICGIRMPRTTVVGRAIAMPTRP